MKFEDLRIKNGRVEVLRRLGLRDTLPIAKKSWPIEQCEATVDSGQGRITMTRYLAVGPSARAMRKGGVFLTIVPPDDEPIIREVNQRHEKDARLFAAKINAAK